MVWTDYNALSYVDTAKLGAIEQRWVAELSAFDYSIRYHPGQVNKNDDLSRQPVTVPSIALPGTALPEGLPTALQKVQP